MQKKVVLFIAGILIFISGFSQVDYDFSEIEKQINKEIADKKIPSIAVAIAKDGKIIYEKAFGFADIENRKVATTATSYQLASASKPFTATGIMLLQHKQKINIEKSADLYMYPLKFKSIKGNSADVRVVDLLNHTSGLGTYFQMSYSDEDTEADDFETAFNKYGTLFYPSGQICEYSNLGYGLLDYIIQKQGGLCFSDFMEKELFMPLGLENTFIDQPKKTACIAKKYDANMQLLPEIYNNTKGAGNIYSSVHDLILFGMFHLNCSNDKKILSRNKIELMQTYVNKQALYHLYDSTYYGLGWYFKSNDNGHKVVWHEGGMMGASSMIKLLPNEKIAIAVIINTSNQQFCQNIADQLAKVVLPEYIPSPINELASYKPYTSDSTYFGNWRGIIKIQDKDIPCTLKIQPDGNIIIEYLDFTYKSYFTQNNPIPNKTFLLSGLVNKKVFIGMFPGDIPSNDIRHEFSQFMSLKLVKRGNVLSGAIVALAAAEREYYAYPYYIQLEKE